MLLDGHFRWSPDWMHGGTAWWVGWLLIASAAILGLVSLGFFLVNRTTVIPHARPCRLITQGPFAISRNPLYIALTAAYCGTALLVACPWPLLLLPGPVAILNSVIIPFQESRLREIFGDAFAGYCRHVRRWL